MDRILPRIALIVLIAAVLASPMRSRGADIQSELSDESPTAEPALSEPLTVEPVVESQTPTEVVDQAPTETQVPTSTLEPTVTQEQPTQAAPTATAEPAATEEPALEPTSPEMPTSTATASKAQTQEPSSSGSPEPGSPVPADASEPGIETLTILSVDQQGNPISDNEGGACFSIEGFIGDPDEDGEYYADRACDGDDGANDGTTTLHAPVDSFGLYERRSPTGYFGIPTQGIQIVAGGPNTVTVPHQTLQTLTVLKVDEQGNPLTDSSHGACFRITFSVGNYYDTFERKACDGGDGANDGTVTLETLPGTGTLTEVRAPDGYYLRGGYHQQVTVVAGASNTVTITNYSIQELTILKVDEEGKLISDSTRGACFVIYETDNYPYHPHCDSDDGVNDGKLTVPAPVGRITVAETRAPSGYRQQRRSILRTTIDPGGPNELTVTNLKYAYLTLYVVDEHGARLTDTFRGACFQFGNWPYVVHACDADDGIRDGKLRMKGVSGSIFLIQTRAPFGYTPSGRQLVNLNSGHDELTVINSRQPPLTVLVVDDKGHRLFDSQGGACFKLTRRGSYRPSVACDADDGKSDGKLTIDGVPGWSNLEQIRNPSGFAPPNANAGVNILRGKPTEITFVNLALLPFTVYKLDEHGDPLTDKSKGACFSFSGESVCDSDDGSNDGRIRFHGIPGYYLLEESRAPDGYGFSPTQYIIIEENGPNEIKVDDVPLQTLKVIVVDLHGDPVVDGHVGACWEFNYGERRACDADDGKNDGVTTFQNVAPGGYFMYESRAPVGYLGGQVIDNAPVTVDGPNEVSVVNSPADILTVFSVDHNGGAATDNRSWRMFAACLRHLLQLRL